MSTVSVNSRPTGFNTGTGRPGFLERVKRIYAYRRILRLLVGRDLKVRYAGSALGYVWSVLDPLLMSLVYWFVFTQIIHRSIGYQPFIVFLLSGQLAWFWISGSINGCARGLRNEARMVRSSNVPREVWVLRVIASKGVEFIFSIPVLVLFAVAYLRGWTCSPRSTRSQASWCCSGRPSSRRNWAGTTFCIPRSDASSSSG